MSSFQGVDSVRLLQEGMRVAALNHRFLAYNIANADTPGFNPVRLDFKATLRAAIEGQNSISLRKTHVQHLDGTRELVKFEPLAISSKNDYNKVDIEEEIANLSDARGKYVTYSALLTKQFSMVKSMLSQLR